jgi:hypothetical protein
MSKLFERHEAREHRLPDTTEALPELPHDVTVPDDVSALTHPETAIGHPASGIRWMRWSSLVILLVAGAIVAALTLRSDSTQTEVPEIVAIGPGSNSMATYGAPTEAIPWNLNDGPGSNSTATYGPLAEAIPWNLNEGPGSNSMATTVAADDGTVFDLSEVAAWAEANGLTGLSPASLAEARISVFDLSEVAAFAEANGLTGLSPASLAKR